MSEHLFVGALGVGLACLLRWSVARLHKEHWQIVASVPRTKGSDGFWRHQPDLLRNHHRPSAFGLAVFVILTGAIGVALRSMLALFGVVALFCIPASKVLARLIEGKAHTFSVAGAAFVGVIVAPLAIASLNAMLPPADAVPMLAALAALSVAYVLGEGLGRLGCISFGCCYGKPVEQLPESLRPLFRRFAVVFRGNTKKIAYASGLEGIEVVPVQAMASAIHVGTGLAAMSLFLSSHYAAALLVSLGIAHLWRVLAESLRADHRGGGRISVYQRMSLATLVFTLAAAVGLGSQAGPVAQLGQGLSRLWNPAIILLLEAIWLVIFAFTGWSMVTSSVLSFHVRDDRI